MTTTPALLQTQYRLARHYLNKLRTADAAVRRGQSGTAFFDQEWEQIRHWQTWAASRWSSDTISARLCKEFPLAGLEVLSNRNNFAEHAAWLESGLKATRQLGDTQAECVLLNELHKTYFRLGALEQAEQQSLQLRQVAENIHDRLSLGRAFEGLGTIAEERGHYSDAEQYYHKSLQIFAELGTEFDTEFDTGLAYHGLGAIALYVGDFEKAYHYFTHSLELMEVAGRKAEICDGLLAVSEALLSLENNNLEARQYIQRAINLSRTLSLRRTLSAALMSMGSAAVEDNQFEMACTSYSEGIAVARSIGSQRNVIYGLSNLGYTQMRLGNYNEALAQLQEGLSLAREAGMPRYICNLQRNLANTYLAVGDLESTRGALREALTIAVSLEATYQKVRTLAGVIALYTALHYVEQAAVWAGLIWEDPIVDQPLFEPICVQLEEALGEEHYHAALDTGKALSLDDVILEVIILLDRLELPQIS